MNSAFRRHGIERLSASSINAWLDSPGMWALRYLANLKEDTSAAMARGLAVEAALLQVLHGKVAEDAASAALDTFRQNLAGEVTEESENEELLIVPMIEQLYRWEHPKVIASQVKIEHWLEGVSIPLIGYVDFTFEDAPLLDLKTTTRIPSKPYPHHVRQVALYMTARNERGALLYVSDKRQAYYEIDEAARDKGMTQLHSAALSLERFLSRFDSSEDAIRCLPMNEDSYKFGKQAEQKLVELHL